MSKTKSYNQIIFLTTLSVYLGLVLVGASPQVLAQAALTSKFEIKDQIEKKDDLDKKPDGNPNFKEFDIANALSVLLNDLQELNAKNSDNENFYWRRERVVSLDNSIEVKNSSSSNDRSKDSIFEKFFDSIDNEQFRGLADFVKSEKRSKNISFEVYPTLESNIKLLISFQKENKENANYLADLLNVEFAYRANKAKQNLAKLVYQNTLVITENNQVFIVTRLPRAAIDSLIKQ
jgi:hypothetical protein